MHTYELSLSAVAGAPRATVSLELPATWTAEVAADGAPTFSAPGLSGLVFGLSATPTDDVEPAARIAQAFKWQYEDGEGVTREELADGRLWAVRVEGRITHARVFVPVDGGVVMAVAMLREVTPAQLAEIKAAFSSLRAGKA
ncbi:MAG: hypothetical protein R3B06_06645 [Kofleriaceae bacterium]